MRAAALMVMAGLLAEGAHAQTPAQTSVQTAARDSAQTPMQMPAEPSPPTQARPSGPVQQKLVPGMARYTDEVLFEKVWPDPALSPRDRSLAVIAVLIATHKPAQLQGHLGRALANGVTPAEASAVLTHLAFYAGWPSAVSALEVYQQVYTARQIDATALRADVAMAAAGSPDADLAHAALAPAGSVAPAFVEIGNQIVFGDLWRRTDLAVRDRSLVTIAALAAMGDTDLLAPYLRRGRQAGLTSNDVGHALTHLAFYAGWGKATRALAVLAAQPDDGASPQVNGRVVQSLTMTQGARVWPKGSAPITTAPAQRFTGAVQVSSPYAGTGGSRLGGATVTFQPGARTAWHRHPMGQLMIVTDGCGWTQAKGGPVQRICPGDVAWVGPGELHWHGATPTQRMTHVTAAETIEGQSVEWFEHVSDDDYARGPAGR